MSGEGQGLAPGDLLASNAQGRGAGDVLILIVNIVSRIVIAQLLKQPPTSEMALKSGEGKY